MAAFEGFDWTELTRHWGLSVTGDDDTDLEATQKYIGERAEAFFIEGDTAESALAAGAVRAFATALAGNDKQCAPLLLGLAAVEDDHAVLVAAELLLPMMWI